MQSSNVIRAVIANITPEGLALKVSEHNVDWPSLPINATLNKSIGVSPQWGEEYGTTLETTAPWDTLALFLREVLIDLNEECAYLTENGAHPFLFWADGNLEPLTQGD